MGASFIEISRKQLEIPTCYQLMPVNVHSNEKLRISPSDLGVQHQEMFNRRTFVGLITLLRITHKLNWSSL